MGQAAHARSRIEALDRQRQRLLKLYQMGEIDDPYLQRELARLRDQRTALESQVVDSSAELSDLRPGREIRRHLRRENSFDGVRRRAARRLDRGLAMLRGLKSDRISAQDPCAAFFAFLAARFSFRLADEAFLIFFPPFSFDAIRALLTDCGQPGRAAPIVYRRRLHHQQLHHRVRRDIEARAVDVWAGH